ncbi:O-antigen ligase family protein [Candidatus Parcubacteria bacterium]|nr:O-antigen ligase family protein [Candidatus Parcubacteria bacterium]
MSQKIYLYILKIGSFLALISIFFVFKNLLFPFITSKQIPFNILIEVLLVFWVALIVKYPEYNPFKNKKGKNFITYGLIFYFAVMVISCFTGVDLNLSFWGDIERMLGAFHILHFFGLYLILITVFRDWKDWKEMMIWSLILSVFLSLKGISDMGYSTLGNTSYVSGYLIFNMYFAMLLFFKERNTGLKWLYLIPLPIILMAFNKAGTSGAMVGLGFSILAVLFLYGLLNKNKKIKIISISVFVLATIIIANIFIFNRDNFLTRNIPALNDIVKDISLNKATFQTRLISWNAALQDFKEHPFFGTGHGNYAIVFDKYFDPVFLTHTSSETYFDRAHNNVIDIASTTGSIGLLAYLSIFIAIAWYLIKKYRADEISIHEFSLLVGLFTAYFVQNLAVFDSLATYLMLMLTLAYVHWLNVEEDGFMEHTSFRFKGFVRELGDSVKVNNKEIYALLIVGVIMSAIALQYNIKPWQMLIGTIDGQRYWAQGKVLNTYEAYKETLKLDTVLDRDSRTSFVRLVISNPNILKNLEKEKADEVLGFAIDLAKINVEYNEGDSLNQMMLAQVYNVAAGHYASNGDKYSFYMNRALEAVEMSITASPGRVPIYYQKAQIQITRGNLDGAIETLKYAEKLLPEYSETHCYLAKTLLYNQKKDEAAKYVENCVDLGGASKLTPVSLLKTQINEYINKKDWERVIKMYDALTVVEKNNPEVWIKAAALYKQQGLLEKAEKAALKAIELDPKVKDNAERFIEGLGEN